jgi:hypothetical protein
MEPVDFIRIVFVLLDSLPLPLNLSGITGGRSIPMLHTRFSEKIFSSFKESRHSNLKCQGRITTETLSRSRNFLLVLEGI